jgi:hypothetical protein
MNEKLTSAIIAALAVTMIVLGYFLIQQRTQLAALKAELAEHAVQLEKLGATIRSSQERQTAAMIRSLGAGVYQLTADVVVDPADAEHQEYLIYNFVVDFNVASVRQKLHFGYGKKGFATHVIYFDYDGDGRIDTKMMNEFAKEVPGLTYVANWFMDPEHSQAVYDAFRDNVDKAEPLAMDGLTDAASKTVDEMWDWLVSQTDDFSAWVEKTAGMD